MAGKSLVHISVISVARTWPWMACDYSEICLLLAERMVSAMLLTALFRLFRKVNTFYWHAGKLWSLLRTNQSTALAEEWILLSLPLFSLTRLLWVLCCKNMMVMGPHGLQLCFLYLHSSTVKNLLWLLRGSVFSRLYGRNPYPVFSSAIRFLSHAWSWKDILYYSQF